MPHCERRDLYHKASLTMTDVTDDMVKRAAAALLAAYLRNTFPAWDKRNVREALEAALKESK